MTAIAVGVFLALVVMGAEELAGRARRRRHRRPAVQIVAPAAATTEPRPARPVVPAARRAVVHADVAAPVGVGIVEALVLDLRGPAAGPAAAAAATVNVGGVVDRRDRAPVVDDDEDEIACWSL